MSLLFKESDVCDEIMSTVISLTIQGIYKWRAVPLLNMKELEKNRFGHYRYTLGHFVGISLSLSSLAIA